MNASKAEPATDETTYVSPPSPNSASTRQEASIAEQVVLQQPVLPGDTKRDVEMAPAPAEPDPRQVKIETPQVKHEAPPPPISTPPASETGDRSRSRQLHELRHNRNHAMRPSPLEERSWKDEPGMSTEYVREQAMEHIQYCERLVFNNPMLYNDAPLPTCPLSNQDTSYWHSHIAECEALVRCRLGAEGMEVLHGRIKSFSESNS